VIDIPPTSPLSRLGLRLSERRARKKDPNTGLTSEDESNIESFEAILTSTLDLLRQENDALQKRDIAKVTSFFEEKARLLETLEIKQPVVEPFLKLDVPAVQQLRALIRELAEQIKLNERMLHGMAQASRTILTEVEHLRTRQSLQGIYTKSGQLREGVAPKPIGKGFEKKF
jgi:hypothetical protein